MVTLGLVGCAAGGLEEILPKLIEPMQERGWRVAVTLTPTAATWLDATGDIEKIEQVTGYPVRVKPRLPSEKSPHPAVDCYAVVPATFNTVGKLALGLADNQALTQVCEAIGLGSVPIVVFPASMRRTRVNRPGMATSRRCGGPACTWSWVTTCGRCTSRVPRRAKSCLGRPSSTRSFPLFNSRR